MTETDTSNPCTENNAKDIKTVPDLPPCPQRLLNILASYLWISNWVVVYWLSTWQLVEKVLFKTDDVYISILISMTCALSIYFTAFGAQAYIFKLATGYGKVWETLAVRLYTYVLAFGSVNIWRYPWRSWDNLTSTSSANGMATFFGAFCVMVVLGLCQQLMEVPCSVGLDIYIDSHFYHDTYFHSKHGTWQHVLDSLSTAIVSPFLVATVWRGLWVLWDNVLAPDNPFMSGLYSFLIGFGVYVFLQISRPMLMRLSAWTDGRFWLWKYLVEDLHTFLSVIVCISHWRGMWFMLDNIPTLHGNLKYWVGHVISFLMLSMFMATNSIINRGCRRDGVKTKGQGINMDMHYVTNILNHWPQIRRLSKHCSTSKPIPSDVSESGQTDKDKEPKNGHIDIETIPVLSDSKSIFYS